MNSAVQKSADDTNRLLNDGNFCTHQKKTSSLFPLKVFFSAVVKSANKMNPTQKSVQEHIVGSENIWTPLASLSRRSIKRFNNVKAVKVLQNKNLFAFYSSQWAASSFFGVVRHILIVVWHPFLIRQPFDMMSYIFVRQDDIKWMWRRSAHKKSFKDTMDVNGEKMKFVAFSWAQRERDEEGGNGRASWLICYMCINLKRVALMAAAAVCDSTKDELR